MPYVEAAEESLEIAFQSFEVVSIASVDSLMQAPLELVGLGSSSSMDSFASWKINGSGNGEGRERGDATSRRR